MEKSNEENTPICFSLWRVAGLTLTNTVNLAVFSFSKQKTCDVSIFRWHGKNVSSVTFACWCRTTPRQAWHGCAEVTWESSSATTTTTTPSPPAAVHNTSQEQDGDVYSCSFQEEKVSALQVVDAKVRLGRISARIDCSLTCLAGLGQEKARLASLKLPSLGMPSGVLCLTLLPPDWVVARMPQVSSWITYSLCLSHY